MDCGVTGPAAREWKGRSKKYSNSKNSNSSSVKPFKNALDGGSASNDDVIQTRAGDVSQATHDDITMNGGAKTGRGDGDVATPSSKKEKRVRHRKNKKRRGCNTGGVADKKGKRDGNGGARTGGSTGKGRYKTELCRTFDESGECRYGEKCQFAHGEAQLRSVDRHVRYKTDLCRTFHAKGFCPYGARCHFIHNELDRILNTTANQLMLCQMASGTENDSSQNQQISQLWSPGQQQIERPLLEPQHSLKELERMKSNDQQQDQGHPEQQLQEISRSQKLLTEQLKQRLNSVDAGSTSAMTDIIGELLKSTPFEALPFSAPTTFYQTNLQSIDVVTSSVNVKESKSRLSDLPKTANVKISNIEPLIHLRSCSLGPAVSSLNSSRSGCVNPSESFDSCALAGTKHLMESSAILNNSGIQGIQCKPSCSVVPASQIPFTCVGNSNFLNHPITCGLNDFSQMLRSEVEPAGKLRSDNFVCGPSYRRQIPDGAISQHNGCNQILQSIPSKLFPIQNLLPEQYQTILARTTIPRASLQTISDGLRPASTALPQQNHPVSNGYSSIDHSQKYNNSHPPDKSYNKISVASTSRARPFTVEMAPYSIASYSKNVYNGSSSFTGSLEKSMSGFTGSLEKSMNDWRESPKQILDKVSRSTPDASPIPSPESDDSDFSFSFLQKSDQLVREQELLKAILSDMYIQRFQNEAVSTHWKYEPLEYERLMSVPMGFDNFGHNYIRYQDHMKRAVHASGKGSNATMSMRP